MRAGIFVASYAKDFPFLHGLVKSIQKFCHGFHRVSIAVPLKDKPLLLKLLSEWGWENGDNGLLVWDQQPEIKHDFMRAQYSMMTMDRMLWDCDLLFLVGSDSLFFADVTPEHYLLDGKPAMRIRDYEAPNFKKTATRCWIPGTEKATGFKVRYEYMAQLPLVYTPRMLKVTRQHVRAHVGRPLARYIDAPHKDFSESNIMGICAHNLCPEECHWLVDQPLPRPTNLLQFWSHGGLKGHKVDRSQVYNNRFGKTENTHGKTAYEVTVDILGENY